jgi:hypothetical protein
MYGGGKKNKEKNKTSFASKQFSTRFLSIGEEDGGTIIASMNILRICGGFSLFF